MDFPPLEDTRWDRLLGAVIGQRPTVADPDAPLAMSWPSALSRLEAQQDEPEPWQHTIESDTYV